MANYSEEKRRYHIERIRALLVRNASMGILQIQEALEKSRTEPMHLDKNYIGKCLRKIKGERATRLNHATVDKYLAEFADEIDQLKKQLWVIVQNPETWSKDKIAAIRELRNSSTTLFDKMFDSGIFTRKLGEVKVNDLTPEQEAILAKALNYANERNERAGTSGDTEQPSPPKETSTE